MYPARDARGRGIPGHVCWGAATSLRVLLGDVNIPTPE
jgi:hypothetical protein